VQRAVWCRQARTHRHEAPYEGVADVAGEAAPLVVAVQVVGRQVAVEVEPLHALRVALCLRSRAAC
jgi:hypothetical protein